MSDAPVLHHLKVSHYNEKVRWALDYKGIPHVRRAATPGLHRKLVRELTGGTSKTFPVLVENGYAIGDSSRIIAHLEDRYPEPPLYPREPSRRAERVVFVDWFNRVWKVPPNAIAAELGRSDPDRDRIRALAGEMAGWLDLVERLLAGRDYLFGAELSAADCAAFPFVKYARSRDPADDELFHRILDEHQPLGDDHPLLAAWIERVDARPRAY